MQKFLIFVCLAVAAFAASAADVASASVDETRLLQGEIDRLAAAGGGTLRVRPGVHRSGNARHIGKFKTRVLTAK